VILSLVSRCARSTFLFRLPETMQCLALLGGAFYSISVYSPGLTIGAPADPIFHMSDVARYATLCASDPAPYPTLAIVFFVATLPSLGPSWR
jgi:hypothetical protein